jgi:hypothetical protein
MTKVEIELEDVQLLWDQVVSSMDWGSGFLDEEEMWRILVIGARFGFDVSAHSSHFPKIVGQWEKDNPKPRLDYRTSGAAFGIPDHRTAEWRKYNAALEEWDAQRTEFFMEKLAEAVAKYDMTDPYNPPSAQEQP